MVMKKSWYNSQVCVIVYRFTVATLLVACVVYLTLVVIDSYRQVRAIAGAVTLLLTSIIVSKNLRAVSIADYFYAI